MTNKDRWSGSEKRRYGRIELALTAYHRLCIRGKKVINRDWDIALIDDIGMGGLRFSSNTPYQENDVIQIQIELVDIGKMFKCTAKALRVRETLYKLSYLTAVEFVNVHHDDMKDIEGIVKEEEQD